MVAQNALT